MLNRLYYCGLVIGIWRAFMVSWLCLAHSSMSAVWCPYGMVSWLTLSPFCLWNHCSQTRKRHHHSVPKICMPYSLFNPIVSSCLSCNLYKVFSQQKKSQNSILWTLILGTPCLFPFSLQSVTSICLELKFPKIIYICISTYKQKHHCITSVSLKNNIVINSINNIYYTAWLYRIKLNFHLTK